MIIFLIWLSLVIYGFFCPVSIRNDTYETKKVLNEILKELKSQKNSDENEK